MSTPFPRPEDAAGQTNNGLPKHEQTTRIITGISLCNRQIDSISVEGHDVVLVAAGETGLKLCRPARLEGKDSSSSEHQARVGG
jgi:hypothetical protein